MASLSTFTTLTYFHITFRLLKHCSGIKCSFKFCITPYYLIKIFIRANINLNQELATYLRLYTEKNNTYFYNTIHLLTFILPFSNIVEIFK